MKHRMSRIGVLMTLAFALGSAAHAKVDAAAAARLGKDLTPMGAERAGTADGKVPAWTPAAQRGKLKGEYPGNPAIDGEKPILTITQANMAQYAANLDEGHKRLLSTYATYKMNVYPSHRVANFPDVVMQAGIANATTAELKSTDLLVNAKLGIPFPIPANGAEAMWNQRLVYHGEQARRYNNQLIVAPNGEFQLTKLTEDVRFYYSSIKNPVPAGPGSTVLKYTSVTVAPPRLAGTLILAQEKVDTRDAWIYSPGIGRVRRAPTVCCDNPYEGTDGLLFYDQVNMFNGTLERYDWKLLGKKVMVVPYNSNRIGSPAVKFADLVRPHHMNQDIPRYEFHRVWVVEANIRAGTNHTFHRRVFYLDEDSWDCLAVEDYDSRNQLLVYQEGHMIMVYSLLLVGNAPEVVYHFDSGRYFITALANEDQPTDASVSFPEDYFEASAVQKRATH